MILPFWKSELYVETSSWFPFGKDYQPVSLNRFHDDSLKKLAGLCMDLEGEFFFMVSSYSGCVGSFPREKFFRLGNGVLNLGFMLVLGYSEILERSVIASLALSKEAENLSAGISKCSVWSSGIFRGSSKVIAVVSSDPFYDGSKYLDDLILIMSNIKKSSEVSELSYFAEKFGYERFSMIWENENPFDIRVSQILSEFEYEGTREITGGSPSKDFPPFLGISVSINIK